MAKKKKRDIGDPRVLYKACQLWSKESNFESDTLVAVWNRAVEPGRNGTTFRNYILRNYLGYPYTRL